MERTTVLIVTHDQRVIEHADRVVNMMGGRIVNNSLTRMAVRITRAPGAERGPQGTQRGHAHQDRQRHDRRDAREGETIVREGERGDRYYLIGSGVAEVYKGAPTRRSFTSARGSARISSFFGRPVEHTVRAKTELELYVISQPDFERVLATDKSFESRVRSLLMALNPSR